MSQRQITELTPEQEAKIPEYRERFKSIGLSTEPGDTEVAKKNILALYKILGHEPPPEDQFFVYESPLAMIKAAAKAESEANGTNYEDVLKTFNVWDMSYGQFEAYWVSFYSFINNELPVDKADGIDEAVEIIKNIGAYITYDTAVFACQKPTTINVNDEGQLHCEIGPAIEYKDGYAVYALDGVRVTKTIIDKILRKDDPNYILALPNVEQRLVAIKYFGVGNMLDQLKYQVEDEFEEYILYSVEIEGNREKLLSMKNPSEPKTHYEFVPPEVKSCREAMAWRTGMPVYVAPEAKA